MRINWLSHQTVENAMNLQFGKILGPLLYIRTSMCIKMKYQVKLLVIIVKKTNAQFKVITKANTCAYNFSLVRNMCKKDHYE